MTALSVLLTKFHYWCIKVIHVNVKIFMLFSFFNNISLNGIKIKVFFLLIIIFQNIIKIFLQTDIVKFIIIQ